jgi:hypothetical protein
MPKLLSIFLVGTALFFLSYSSIQATGFSGSDINQYTCTPGAVTSRAQLVLLDIFSNCGDPTTEGVFDCDGRFVCYYLDDGKISQRDAIPTPPSLRIIEVWFVRIIFAIWALSGIVFTFVLISLGVQYMFSFGNPQAVERVIKKFQNFLLGFVLVFLSYPILNTFFNILPINDESQCFEQISMPGFQFFFPQACGAQTQLEVCINQCGDITTCEFACQKNEQIRVCKETCTSTSETIRANCIQNCDEL